MKQPITYVGLDVHKETIAIALAEAGVRRDVREHGKIANTAAAVTALAAKLARGGNELRFCYEAGPCGYGIQRQLTAAGKSDMVADLGIAGAVAAIVKRKPEVEQEAADGPLAGLSQAAVDQAANLAFVNDAGLAQAARLPDGEQVAYLQRIDRERLAAFQATVRHEPSHRGRVPMPPHRRQQRRRLRRPCQRAVPRRSRRVPLPPHRRQRRGRRTRSSPSSSRSW
jgi:hypothetical protein